MSRSLSAEMQAVATADIVRPVLFVECEFDAADGGQLNFWSGYGQITYNSQLYVGAGNLLSIGQISEATELTANGASVTLTGISEPLLTKARDADYQGRKLTIKLGAMDENNDIISSPVELFIGFMDVMSISDDGATGTISVAVENKLIAFDRARVRRYTHEDQKIDHPNDRGLEYVAEIQEKEIVWGRPGSGIKYPSHTPQFNFYIGNYR